MVLEHVKGWDVTDVYVGCSGAFTIERALRHLGLSLHSNDVQLHSCALGWHFSGADVAITVAEIHRGRFAWLERYLIDPADRTATVMLANSLFANSTSTNPWYERMCRAGEAQWPALHAKTVERLRAVDLTVASFYAGDVMEWVGRCKTDQAFLSFPPYMASGYETMFATVDDLFDWPKPDYDIFDEDTRLRLIEQVGAFRHWMLDDAGYQAMHIRLDKRFGKPCECRKCGTTNPSLRYEWANLTGVYADVDDYARMCVYCHRKFDADRRQITGERTSPVRR